MHKVSVNPSLKIAFTAVYCWLELHATQCWTTATPAVFGSCSVCRTLRCVSFSRAPDDHHLSHSSSSCIGSRFDNGLITSWPSWRTRSTTRPLRSTSAVTSSLTPSLVGFSLPLLHECADQLPESNSPTVLFAAPLLLFGIQWLLTSLTLVLCRFLSVN